MFQLAFGLSAFDSGLLVLAVFAGNLAMKPFTTGVMQRWGFRPVLMVNGVLGVLAIAACALLDERIEANLDGLRLAGDAGSAAVRAQVEDGVGEVFAAMAIAVHRRDMRGVAQVLDLVGADAGLLE